MKNVSSLFRKKAMNHHIMTKSWRKNLQTQQKHLQRMKYKILQKIMKKLPNHVILVVDWTTRKSITKTSINVITKLGKNMFINILPSPSLINLSYWTDTSIVLPTVGVVGMKPNKALFCGFGDDYYVPKKKYRKKAWNKQT